MYVLGAGDTEVGQVETLHFRNSQFEVEVSWKNK